MSRLRPIGHDDRLSIVDHLDELRTRLFVCLAVLAVAFGLCFWQNNHLLTVLNRALPDNSKAAVHNGLSSVPSESVQFEQLFTKQPRHRTPRLPTPPASRPRPGRPTSRAPPRTSQVAKTLPKSLSTQEKPVTLGVGESFTTTLTVAAYFALLFSLPILIYEGYAFVIPALDKNERRAAFPVMAAAPLLFLAGVVFTYFVVLPPAVHFLQGYNADQFQVLVQAKSYYSFEILTMLAVGLAFQLPLGMLGLHRVGVINGKHSDPTLALRYGHHRRGRRGDAGGRSSHDRTGDGAACNPLPRQHRVAQDRRSPRRGPGRP